MFDSNKIYLLMKFFISLVVIYFTSINAKAKPIGLSCYFDTGVRETNSTITYDEVENKTFSMMYDYEIEWFWRFPPEGLSGQKIDDWKKEKNYLFRNTNNTIFVSINFTIKDNELNLESNQKNRLNEMYITQYYELDPKLNITYVNYKIFTYSHYEKKTKITRKGKCIR